MMIVAAMVIVVAVVVGVFVSKSHLEVFKEKVHLLSSRLLQILLS